MPYRLCFSFALGSSKTGISDLRGQLVDTSGSNVGSAVSSGFVEIGAGNYLWDYASFADGFRGGVKFYSNSAPSSILGFCAINPEEGENADTKVSTRSSHSANDAADAILKRDWTAISGEASRSVLNALRFIRNRFSTTTNLGYVQVFKEDDATLAFEKPIVTDTESDPIVEG